MDAVLGGQLGRGVAPLSFRLSSPVAVFVATISPAPEKWN